MRTWRRLHPTTPFTWRFSRACSLLARKFTQRVQLGVSCSVTNTGEWKGDEVVQLYYHTKRAHVVRPVKQLAGFRRVSLAAGEAKRLTFELNTAQLGYYNEDMEFVVEPTTMDVMLGTSSENIAFVGEVRLTGPKVNVLHKRAYTCPVVVE